jgi:hypothetical protein
MPTSGKIWVIPVSYWNNSKDNSANTVTGICSTITSLARESEETDDVPEKVE